MSRSIRGGRAGDRRFASAALSAAWFGLLVAVSCSLGSDGSDPVPPELPAPPEPPPPVPPPGPEPTRRDYARGESVPELSIELVSVDGASGQGGRFRIGDPVAVRFRLVREDGTRWPIEEMDSGVALVSGPTTNYQRVLAAEEDVASRATVDGKGVYTFAFGGAIPATYLPPYNDSPSYDATDGELSGEPLEDGAYSLGISFAWRYSVEGQPRLRVAELTRDVLVGTTTGFAPREVVGRDNCNRCHVELSAHDSRYRDLTLCLMCHTAGAEDLNDPAIAGGTPGVSIDSRVLFHRIHNGRHLPSVVGMTTLPDGSRNYDAPPVPFLVARSDGVVRDFSGVGSPGWPHRTIPSPRDVGYLALTPEQQAQEDRVRTGETRCDLCHGDPDGPGPIKAPRDGNAIYVRHSRHACGACHDDVNFDYPYVANNQQMPPQMNNISCVFCHGPGILDAFEKHVHPLLDTDFGTGLVFRLWNVREGTGSNGNGRIEVGERVAITLSVRDDSGTEVDPLDVSRIELVISGPVERGQVLLRTSVAPAALAGPQPFKIDVPARRLREFVGDATALPGDVFETSAGPHSDVDGARTIVFLRTDPGGPTSILSDDAVALQNFIDVDDATQFSRGDTIVIDDGLSGLEEYLSVQFVQEDRLWFSSPNTPAFSPGLRGAHAFGASVRRVVITEAMEGVDYSLDPATGTVTELTEMGAGTAVLVDYTAPFEVPAVYPNSLNGSPDLGEAAGRWTGRPVVDGTYSIGVWGSIDKLLTQPSAEDTPYRITSEPATSEFLLGQTALLEPYTLISSGDNCLVCHQDLYFHEGTVRGFESCILCHGGGGGEDLPQYVAANAPATAGVGIDFRNLLHRVHHGSQLEQGADFVVVGANDAIPYPDNFRLNTYEQHRFPAMPGKTMQCERCHGAGNTAWQEPRSRAHPAPTEAPLDWTAACISCHDSSAAHAHAATQVLPTGEACADCHGLGQELDIPAVHGQ